MLTVVSCSWATQTAEGSQQEAVRSLNALATTSTPVGVVSLYPLQSDSSRPASLVLVIALRPTAAAAAHNDTVPLTLISSARILEVSCMERDGRFSYLGTFRGKPWTRPGSSPPADVICHQVVVPMPQLHPTGTTLQLTLLSIHPNKHSCTVHQLSCRALEAAADPPAAPPQQQQQHHPQPQHESQQPQQQQQQQQQQSAAVLEPTQALGGQQGGACQASQESSSYLAASQEQQNLSFGQQEHPGQQQAQQPAAQQQPACSTGSAGGHSYPPDSHASGGGGAPNAPLLLTQAAQMRQILISAMQPGPGGALRGGGAMASLVASMAQTALAHSQERHARPHPATRHAPWDLAGTGTPMQDATQAIPAISPGKGLGVPHGMEGVAMPMHEGSMSGMRWDMSRGMQGAAVVQAGGNDVSITPSGLGPLPPADGAVMPGLVASTTRSGMPGLPSLLSSGVPATTLISNDQATWTDLLMQRLDSMHASIQHMQATQAAHAAALQRMQLHGDAVLQRMQGMQTCMEDMKQMLVRMEGRLDKMEQAVCGSGT